MLESTNRTQRDTLSTQENVDLSRNTNSDLIKREEIDGTPFTLVTATEKQLKFIAIGMNKLTHNLWEYDDNHIKTKWIEQNKWDLLLNTTLAIIDQYNVHKGEKPLSPTINLEE